MVIYHHGDTEFSARQWDIDGTLHILMPNVVRRGSGWRVTAEHRHQGRLSSDFRDVDYGGAGHALNAANDWLGALDPPIGKSGNTLTHVQNRKVCVLRRVRHEAGVLSWGLELRLNADRPEWQRPWMSLDLGAVNDLDQYRLNWSVAVLHGRWFKFLRNRRRLGVTAALDRDYSLAPPVAADTHDTRLRLEPLCQWAGSQVQPAPIGQRDRASAAAA